MSTITHLITADELLNTSHVGRCELINGEIVMMSPAGAEHGVIALRFGRYLGEFVETHDLGSVFAAETGFKIAGDPDLVRAPDAGYVRKDRLADGLPKGYFEGTPDLAVEVLSPGDQKRDVAEKIAMWLAHGTKVVWEADARTMTVTVHRVGQVPQRLDIQDTLLEEALLPGFALALTRIFKLP